MLKKVISSFLVVLVCITSVQVFAEKESVLSYTDQQEKKIYEKYVYNEDFFNNIFCVDRGIAYWKMVNNMEQYYKFEDFLIDKSSELIGEKPDKKDYAEILTNLIMMQEGDFAEQLETQSRFDNLKDTKDYVFDIIDIADDFIGGSGILKKISPIITAVMDGKTLVETTLEEAKYYELTIKSYAQSNNFLDAVKKYADNEELCNVADALLKANDKLLEKRLEFLTNSGEAIAEYEANFFIKELSFELLKSSEIYNDDEVVKWFVDCGSVLKDSILSYFSMGKFAFHMTMLAGNIGFGTANTFNRYQEMKVIKDIAEAIIEANNKIQIPDSYNDKNTIENIQLKCNYYKMLLVTHARGEYLIYQLLMNDANLLSIIRSIFDTFKDPNETTDSWYEGQKDILIRYYDILDNIFTVSNESNNDIVVDAYSYVYSDQYGEYKYNIPKIILDGNEIESINEEIWNSYYESVMKEQLNLISNNSSINVYGISYTWAVNNDILSIIIETNFDGNNNHYEIYNISMNTGEKLKISDILNCKEWTYEQYAEKVKYALGSLYWDKYYDMFTRDESVTWFGEEAAQRQLDNTISDNNVSEAIPYLNENGELCVAGFVYSLAGADRYYHKVNLETFEMSPHYSENVELPMGGDSSSSNGYGVYVEVINNLLSETNYNSQKDYIKQIYSGNLVDFDKNGTDELVLCYTTDGLNVLGQVWSIQNGKAVCMLNDITVTVMAGQPDSEFCLGSSGGKEYICLYRQFGDTFTERERWQLFEVSNNGYVLKRTLEKVCEHMGSDGKYTDTPVSEKYMLDDVEVSKSDFDKYKFEEKEVLCGIYGTQIEEFISQLQ